MCVWGGGGVLCYTHKKYEIKQRKYYFYLHAIFSEMSHRTTKPTVNLCDQRRLRSACASAQPLGYPKRDNRELLSYWVDVQVDLSLSWSHKSGCRLCHALAQILYNDKLGVMKVSNTYTLHINRSW